MISKGPCYANITNLHAYSQIKIAIYLPVFSIDGYRVPALENSRSAGTDVAGTNKKRIASL